MRKAGALGQARGPAGELDVDCVGAIQARPDVPDAALANLGRQMGDLVKFEPAWACLATDLDLMLKRRRAHGLDHLQIVTRLVARGCDDRLHAGLFQCVFQLSRAMRRIDRRQDQPDLGGRELGQRPFGAVWRPNAQPITRLKPES